MMDQQPSEPTSSNQNPASSVSEDHDSLPPLFSDQSFWGLMVTQFLGAFNDNLYKQLMLLLALPAAVSVGAKLMESPKAMPQQVAAVAADSGTKTDSATADTNNPEAGELKEGTKDEVDPAKQAGDMQATEGSTATLDDEKKKAAEDDVQGWATLVFALPFVLFGGFAGYLADRFKKTPIIVIAKYAEIGIMGLGVSAFMYYNTFGEFGTWFVLFLMGTHSAFFGPGKYGLLPELFRYKDLARANGLMLMSTFLAIILGMVTAGILKDRLDPSQLWIGSMVCMGIAAVGTITAHLIRHTPPANPNVKLTPDSWGLSKEMIQLFKVDKPLLMAIFVSSIFWLISGMAALVVNKLGTQQLGENAEMTSYLAASIALGIMGGALAASAICKTSLGKFAVNIGLGGILLALILLGMWNGEQQILGYYGSVVALMILGVCAAIFSIPVQVFLQARPPKALKGRLIATMNQANFVGILLAGPLYQLCVKAAASLGWPTSSMFWMMGLIVLPLAFFYRLDSRVSEVDKLSNPA
ncbi:MAG: MFS transporter [Pirellulales bacterium]